jgi:hypothetical protein
MSNENARKLQTLMKFGRSIYSERRYTGRNGLGMQLRGVYCPQSYWSTLRMHVIVNETSARMFYMWYFN